MKAFDIYSAIGNISRDILEESENCKKSKKEEFSVIVNEKIHSSKTETVKKDTENEKIHFRKYPGAASIAVVAACMAVMIIGIRVLVNMTDSGVIDNGELISIKTETVLTSEFAPSAWIETDDDTDYSQFFQVNYSDWVTFEISDPTYADTVSKSCKSDYYTFDDKYVRSILPFDVSEFSSVNGSMNFDGKGDPDTVFININDLPAEPENEEYPHSKYINITVQMNSARVRSDLISPVQRYGTDVYYYRESDNDNILHTDAVINGTGYSVVYGNMSCDEAGKIMDQIILDQFDASSFDISKADKHTTEQGNITLEEAKKFEIFNSHLPVSGSVQEYMSEFDCSVSYNSNMKNDVMEQLVLNISYYNDESSINMTYQYPSFIPNNGSTVISPVGLFTKEDFVTSVGITDNSPAALGYIIDFNDFDIFVNVNNCNIDMLWEVMKSILPTDERMSSAQEETSAPENENAETIADTEAVRTTKKNFYNDNEPVEISTDEYEKITFIDHTALYNIKPEMTYDDVIELLGETADPADGAYAARYIYTRFIYGDESLSAEYYDEYLIDIYFPTKDSTVGQSANQLLSKAVPVIAPY